MRNHLGLLKQVQLFTACTAFTLLLGLLPVLTPGSASAARGKTARGGKGPVVTLKSIQRRLTALLARQVKKGSPAARARELKLKALVNRFLDFGVLARHALGKHWKKRSEAERKEFVALVRELIERSYLRRIHSGKSKGEKIKIEYRKHKITGSKAVVFTRVVTRGKGAKRSRVRVTYKMHRRDGRWIVTDAETNDESLTDLYREQFYKIIRKKDYADLVRRLKRKIKQLRKRG